ncbi:MAG: GAF domain-containing protein [Chlorobi bacterium]|nr:GAF domain-containing protein [Chlorobiota bacterium]
MKNMKVTNIVKAIVFSITTVVLLSLGIYFFMSVYPSAVFFMVYIVALSGILLLHLYTEMQIRKLNETLEKYYEENTGLRNKIEELKKNIEEKNRKSTEEKQETDIPAELARSFAGLPSFDDKKNFCNNVLNSIATQFEIVTGLFFVYDKQSENFSVEGNYGIMKDEEVEPFSPGEGLHGTAVDEGEVITLEDVPEEYFSGYSGLGEAKPAFIYILPVGQKDDPVGVIEVASFRKLEFKRYWNDINKMITERILTEVSKDR